jgi:DnaJ-class molecular chaperone
MYGKNYYQVYNEVVFELRSAGHPEEQIRLACLAMESTKCGYCNGYGRRGHYLCEACRGDGVLEN